MAEEKPVKLSVQPSLYRRGGVFYAKVRHQDRTWHNYNTRQASRNHALVVAEEFQARADRGLPPVEKDRDIVPAAILTLRQLSDRFMKEYQRGRIKDIELYRKAVRQDLDTLVLPHLGNLPVLEIRRPQVAGWMRALQDDGYTPRSVNRAMARLSGIYTWAITMEIIDCRNPCYRMERMRVEQVDDFFTLEEVHRLLSLPDLPPMITTALYTAMRKGELFGLRWSCVRFDLGAIEVRWNYNRLPKNGKPRTIPLHSELAPILREWQKRCPQTEAGLVFPVAMRRPRMGTDSDMADLCKWLEKAKCHVPEPHPWHATRHTTATLMLEAGATRDAVEQILGHRSSGSAVTTGYLHTGLSLLSKEMAKLSLLPPAPAGVSSLDEERRKRVVQG